VEGINRKIDVQAAWAQMRDPLLKITKVKRVGGMAQIIACLLSKREALSSNPSTAKKNSDYSRMS
jgi:hypothetical protein